jgi:hypothetical protein
MSMVATTAQPSRPASSSSGPEWGASAFVWGVLLLVLLADLLFVGKFGLDFPDGDEWIMAPVLTGEQPLTVAWLWSPCNEHRVPLAKLILLALYKISGYDFRAAMFFNVLALSALASAMVFVAKTLRGRTSYVDAFFPLILLHWGQYDNFLWGWQVHQVLSAILVCLLLVAVVRRGARLTLGSTILAGACLLLLPMCGAMGLVFVPLFALWLGYCGVLTWSSPETHRKRNSLLMFGVAGAGFLLEGLYFHGYQSTARVDPPSLQDSLRTAAQFLSVNFGLAASPLWPFSALAMIGLLLLGVAALILVWLRQPEDRFRVLGLLAMLVSIAVLALAIGWGRADLGPEAGFASRYVVLAVPALCWVYLTWGLYKGPSAGLAQMVLFTLACAVFSINAHLGLQGAKDRNSICRLEEFDQDLRDGVSPRQLAERYADIQVPWLSPEEFAGLLGRMRQAGIGRFQFPQKDDQPVTEDFRQVVRAKLPFGATVLVVSKGDDDLLKFKGRTGWHFPQDEDGAYAGNPADSADAVARLEALRAKGAGYLLFPEPAFWWLEEYPGFKQHLDQHYTRVYGDEHCIIYQLSAPKPD